MTPGDPSIVSIEHDDLVQGLYQLRDRLKRITAEERLIVEAAIMMCEYLVEYAADSPWEDGHELLSMEEIRTECAKRAEDRKKYPVHWTFEDFERLICSGGFELTDGRLVPRF
jgi:hypothetical protein